LTALSMVPRFFREAAMSGRLNWQGIPAILVGVMLVGVCLGTLGCGGGGEFPVAPAEGKVLYRGTPLQFGSVMFQPEAGPPARGDIQPDGTFVLSTYGDGDGAIIGKHQVRITCYESQSPNAPPPDPNREPTLGKSLIPEKYARLHSSGLNAEVKETNEPFVFELQ